jgi:ribosomal protein S18 acetylase RimI-like enzyme
VLADFVLRHGATELRIVKITADSLEQATAVVQRAFAMWADSGFKPQSAELVASYLLPDGYAAVDSSQQVIATFCVRDARPQLEADTVAIRRAHRLDRARLYSKDGFRRLVTDKSFVYFYGFAVDPLHGRAGLGKALLAELEQAIKKLGYHGLMLETGKDSRWLVEWYERLGFEVIGESDPEISPARTVMMLKSL